MSVRDEILGRKPKTVKITLRDGIDIWVKLVGYEEGLALIASQKNAKDEDYIDGLVSWIIASLVNEDGSQAFTEDDRPAIRKKDTQFILELGAAVSKTNTPTQEDTEKNS